MNSRLHIGAFWAIWVSCLAAQAPRQPAQITGRVVDLAGSPIAGASVTIRDADKPEIVTDSKGRFHIANIAPGEGLLLVKFRGFRAEKVTYNLGPGDHISLDVGLVVENVADSPRLRVEGIVRNSMGLPLSDTTVTFRAYYNSRIMTQTRSDTAGYYAVSLSIPGQYEVSAISRDGASCIVETRYWAPWKPRTLDLTIR